MSLSSRLSSFVLILVVMLTGIGLGAARGVVRQGDEIVLCTGHGVVVTQRPDGQGAAHLCPDMALSLMAALGGAAPVVPERIARADGFDLVAQQAILRAIGRVTRARDPPAGAV
ncbi:hypothetical protein [Paracoccus sp. R86501]|uniref:hypothetical protein n=1 Tax=Paracoccus sp. R86501 TaxID=3101711 RepID=UPI0036725369